MNAITLSNFKLHLSLRAKHPQLTNLEMKAVSVRTCYPTLQILNIAFGASFLKGDFVPLSYQATNSLHEIAKSPVRKNPNRFFMS